jgi:hypothetical protein
MSSHSSGLLGSLRAVRARSQPSIQVGCLALLASLVAWLRPAHAQEDSSTTASGFALGAGDPSLRQADTEASDARFAPLKRSKHSVFLELGGAGLLYSANYEFRPAPEIGMRLGLGAWTVCAFSACTTIVPIPASLFVILGGVNNHLEVGVSETALVADHAVAGLPGADLGYRYERPEGGFLFRVGTTPFLLGRSVVVPWGGISFGYGW